MDILIIILGIWITTFTGINFITKLANSIVNKEDKYYEDFKIYQYGLFVGFTLICIGCNL